MIYFPLSESRCPQYVHCMTSNVCTIEDKRGGTFSSLVLEKMENEIIETLLSRVKDRTLPQHLPNHRRGDGALPRSLQAPPLQAAAGHQHVIFKVRLLSSGEKQPRDPLHPPRARRRHHRQHHKILRDRDGPLLHRLYCLQLRGRQWVSITIRMYFVSSNII